MDKSLVECLDQVLDLPEDVLRSANVFETPPWTTTEEGNAFLSAIKAADALEIFDNSLQIIGYAGRPMDRTALAMWLVDRARFTNSNSKCEK